MKITVVGTGYVGLVTGTCFSEFGVDVTCVDRDATKIEALNRGEIPIYEPGLEEIVSRNHAEGRLRFTTDLGSAVRGSAAVFIAVGTPQGDDGSADLSYVDQVARDIAPHLNGYKVIVTKSTVPVGTGQRVKKLIGEAAPKGARFDVASNPEFLREGSAVEDCMRPNRVVIGTDSEQAAALLRELYRPLYLIETPFVMTDIATAELIKYAANAFLATKVSFINEVANLAEAVGGDVQVVAKAMGLDGRIGSKFLHAGPGFGGSCFPKDVAALERIATDVGYDFALVRAVREVNSRQRVRMVDKIRAAVGGNVDGCRLAFLGLSFKPNTDDMREAPSIDIIRALKAEGAMVRGCDPVAEHEARKVLPEVDFFADAYTTAEDADAIVIVTEWNRFRNLDLERLKGLMRQPVMMDLRNIYNPSAVIAAGFSYHCVGRAGYR
ncbi:MAG: UDP-glucose/GDP-mannose dehydrogenase family protein [Nitrospirota bacterium]|nr:UDP-glucose/GDP-mannose dehydrogenase family protein [Nitrospirota bacterium]